MRAAVFVLLIFALSLQYSQSYALQGGWNLTKINNNTPSNPIYLSISDIVVNNNIVTQMNFTGCRSLVYVCNPSQNYLNIANSDVSIQSNSNNCTSQQLDQQQSIINNIKKSFFYTIEVDNLIFYSPNGNELLRFARNKKILLWNIQGYWYVDNVYSIRDIQAATIGPNQLTVCNGKLNATYFTDNIDKLQFNITQNDNCTDSGLIQGLNQTRYFRVKDIQMELYNSASQIIMEFAYLGRLTTNSTENTSGINGTGTNSNNTNTNNITNITTISNSTNTNSSTNNTGSNANNIGSITNNTGSNTNNTDSNTNNTSQHTNNTNPNTNNTNSTANSTNSTTNNTNSNINNTNSSTTNSNSNTNGSSSNGNSTTGANNTIQNNNNTNNSFPNINPFPTYDQLCNISSPDASLLGTWTPTKVFNESLGVNTKYFAFIPTKLVYTGTCNNFIYSYATITNSPTMQANQGRFLIDEKSLVKTNSICDETDDQKYLNAILSSVYFKVSTSGQTYVSFDDGENSLTLVLRKINQLK